MALAPSLTQLANEHGSDKGTVGPSPECDTHNYTDIYEAYLQAQRDSPIHLIEIGLGVLGDRWEARIVQGRNSGGASLKMWYDYFPKATIYGIDINPCPYLNNERIQTFVADQGNISELEAFVKATKKVQFDCIIDDGSHRPDHQQITLGCLFKQLKGGGLYFIEDLGRNGLGDGATGRSASDKVKNTRAVLKHFCEFGTFLEPNLLGDSAYLTDNISSIHFHAPKAVVQMRFRPSLRRPFRKILRYRRDSELLCAIRKK